MKEEIKEPTVDRYWHLLYIEMQADPTDHRTDTQFCKDCELEVGTFCNWKRKYRDYIFREVEFKRKSYRNEIRARIYKALDKKLDTDTNAIKLLAQLLGDLVEKTEVKTETLSESDKIRRIKTLSQENTKKLNQWNQADKQAGIAEETGSIAKEGSGPISQELGGTEPPTAN